MPKLNYKTLRQEVVDEIRQRILTGDFQAGERIKENEMAQQLGVSRGPVREALRQLEQEGLVQYERNVGCSVAQVSGQDVYEICLLRATLEILAARLLQKKQEEHFCSSCICIVTFTAVIYSVCNQLSPSHGNFKKLLRTALFTNSETNQMLSDRPKDPFRPD